MANPSSILTAIAAALDLAVDGEAKKLVTEAALKCGEVMP